MEDPGYTHPLGHAHTLSVDLGPGFDRRWKGSTLRQRRELLAELHSIYRSLEEQETVLLSRLRLPPRPYIILPEATVAGMVNPAPEPEEADIPLPEPAPLHNGLPPQNLLNMLLRGQVLAEDRLRELMEAPPTPPEELDVLELPQRPEDLAEVYEEEPAPDHSALEFELRQRMGPVIDSLIEEHIQGLRAELRFRLRSELESLISAAAKRH